MIYNSMLDDKMDTNIYIQRLLEANPLREPLLRTVIESLKLPRGSKGLDAGCGIGLQSLLFAEAIGTEGHITGVDILPELLIHGTATVAKLGLSDRITFREADVSRLPFDADTFDWAWSADCIGYPAGDLMPLLQELMRVVKPGGEVILLGWSSQQLLPGHPLLEARLNATCSGYIPFFKEQSPDVNFMRAGHWFQKADLEDIRVQTFVGEVQSPLTSEVRTALISLFEMLWGNPQPETSPEDWRQYQQLCKPESPDFILDIPDYYGFFTYSMFTGKVPT
jgi:demethylmenaquinone methyltransferase/2-methoxy-6-polyprenyl-1,4-benzoquinol methylase